MKWRSNQCAAVAEDLVVTVSRILFSLAHRPFVMWRRGPMVAELQYPWVLFTLMWRLLGL